MTVKKARPVTLISGLAVLFGFFTAFKFGWAQGAERWLSLIGFFLVVFGSLALAASLTRLLFPIEQEFGIKTLFDKHSFSVFKKVIGSKKAEAIGNTCVLICFLLVGIIGYSFFTIFNKYEKEQLDKFGEIQKVRIKNIYTSRGRRAYFDFDFMDKTFTKFLYDERFKIGDSAYIIFSTQNPDIVKWQKDYEKNLKYEQWLLKKKLNCRE